MGGGGRGGGKEGRREGGREGGREGPADMSARDNQPPAPALSDCPFCGKQFKAVGNHLPRCKERDGRDYSSYLSKKTLYNKAKAGSSRKSCPKCHRWFLRLDTHLKNSPFCKSVQQSDSQPQQSLLRVTHQSMSPITFLPMTASLLRLYQKPSPH